MRCPNCGKRIADAIASKVTECPNCRHSLGAAEEGAAATPASIPEDDLSQGLTLPFVPGEATPGQDSSVTAPSAVDGKRVTETGAQKRLTGAYTARFEHEDTAEGGAGAAAGTRQAGPSGAPSRARDTAETSVPRDQAKTPAKAETRATAAGKGASSLPDRLGHFEVRGKLGEGGMGEVLDGYDVQLDRRVAIKVLSQKLGQDEQFVQRFLSEARAVARVAHVNVAGIYFADSDGQRNFFAMEFIEGQALDALIEDGGPLTPKVAVGYVIQAVRGLAAAHERGIIHRDIKPANLMLGKDGVIKVTDFGLAKLTGENVSRTQTGSVMGSPHFMAPEQGRGEATDVRADIYSLGATLYYLLMGKTPYEGDSAVAVILKHQEAPVPQIARAPPSVNRLLSRMMAKDPNGRYQGYANVMTDLVRLDKSGLLRDDVTLEQAAAAARSDRMADVAGATPMGGPAVLGPAPPKGPSSGLQTQKTDHEAALLSQLDAVMKHAPGDTHATASLGKTAGKRLRSAAASVTRKVLGSQAPADEGEDAAAEFEGEQIQTLQVRLIAAAVVVVLLLLIMIALRPWRWGVSEEDLSGVPTESREVLEAIESLRPALEDPEPAVRRDGVMALGRYPGPTSEELLMSTLSDPEPAVRVEAARVLGRIGRKNVRGHLARMLTDDAPEVRQAVAEAIEELTGYTRLTSIDWRKSPEGLRRAVREEFETWMKTH